MNERSKRKQNIHQNQESSEKTAGRVRTSARNDFELDRSFQPSHVRSSHENEINAASHDEIGISFEQVLFFSVEKKM